MFNKACLIGRLGKDPETQYTPGGAAICRFSLATDERYKNRAGETQKRTSWHSIQAWNKLAEICQRYLVKGSLVYIEGSIQYDEWEKDGQKHSRTVIKAREMKMLGGKPAGAGLVDGQIGRSVDRAGNLPAAPADPEPGETTDEDIPF